MKKLMYFFGLLIMTQNSNAQLPTYLPSNGLVGWWPFNGNGNDFSPYSNNLTTNGNITYSTDRFGNPNAVAIFDNVNEYFSKSNPSLPSGNNSRTLSMWIYSTGIISNPNGACPFTYGDLVSGGCYGRFATLIKSTQNFWWNGKCNPISFTNPIFLQVWTHFVLTYESSSNTISLYQNGQLILSQTITGGNNTTLGELRIGSGLDDQNPIGNIAPFDGKIDDVGIWDYVLTQQEITDLYTASNCSNDLAITPTNNQLQIGANASFIATTLDPSPSFIWQSDFGQGFQTLNNYGSYTGANTDSLSIANVQLSNHNQPIRVISASGSCIDTSNIANIVISDTCINTVTNYISVTDTLIINAVLTGLTPPNNINTITVFPNPTKDHIYINTGNYQSMVDYQLKITNSLGQIVYQQIINAQSYSVDLNTFGGMGTYFVYIYDASNSLIDVRKIILQ